jgi:hypothetical protein
MYGDRPPIPIERDLQGLAPIQEESMQTEPHPTNEEDNIGQMYSSKWISYHLSMAVETTNAPLPTQYRDILKLSKEDHGSWMSAMKDKIKSLHERKVWKLVDLPRGHQPIKERWVYVIKPDGHKKARFVAKALHKSLLEMGFCHCKADPGTYYKIIGEEIITLCIYVDDALFMGDNKTHVLAHNAQFMK